MSLLGPLQAPFTVVGSATRNMMNIDVAFGRPGVRWNERDEYRNTYTAPQRAGAGVGNVLGTAAPAIALGAWARYGMHAPGGFTPSVVGGRTAGTLAGAAAGAVIGNEVGDAFGDASTRKLGTLLGAGVGGAAGLAMGGTHGVQTVGVAALAAMTAVGVRKSIQTVQDDGDFRSVGGVTGMVTAGALGYKLGGKWGPLIGAGAGIAGAIGGYQAGKLVDAGPGHVGKGEHPANESPVHTEGIGRGQDFARGMYNHFVEAGPITQGVSFGYTMQQQKHFREDYSQSEQGGAIAGDLAAAVVLGGGAVGLTRAMAAKKGIAAGSTFAKVAFESEAGAWLTKGAINVAKTGGGKAAIGIGALALAGGLTAFEGISEARGNGSMLNSLTFGQLDRHVDKDSKTLGVSTRGLLAGGVGLAAMAGATLLLRGRPVVNAMGGTTMAAGLGAAVLVSALSSARVPVQHVINDVRDVRSQRKQSDPKSAYATGAVGVAAGALAGLAVGKAVKPGIGSIAGLVVGAAAGGALGYGMSPVMPNLAGVATSAGVGAAVLGVAGFAITHDAKSAGKAAAFGGVLGTVAAPMLTHGKPAGSAESIGATGSKQAPATPAGEPARR